MVRTSIEFAVRISLVNFHGLYRNSLPVKSILNRLENSNYFLMARTSIELSVRISLVHFHGLYTNSSKSILSGLENPDYLEISLIRFLENTA